METYRSLFEIDIFIIVTRRLLVLRICLHRSHRAIVEIMDETEEGGAVTSGFIRYEDVAKADVPVEDTGVFPR